MLTNPQQQRGLTILIATYNASWLIEETLLNLHKMNKVPDLPWEVLIVDNNSTDDTLERARRLWQGTTELRIILESRQGTGFAKFRGMQEARYAYIGFVDQDNWINQDWMQKTVSHMDCSPKAALICGRGFPVFESPAPVWFETYQQNYAVGSQNKTNGYVHDPDRFFYTAGSILRKEAFDDLVARGFEPLLRSRSQNQLLSGEDTELQILLKLKSWEVHYQEDIQFRHYMPTQRLGWDYFKKFRQGLGATSVYLDLYRHYLKNLLGEGTIPSQNWQSLLVKSLKTVLNDPLAISASLFPCYAGNYRVARFWSHQGEFLERLRIRSELESTKEKLYQWLDSIPSSAQISCTNP